MTDEVYNEVQRKMHKLEGLRADLEELHDAICDLRDADEDSPWVLRYLRDQTICMESLHGKARAILQFMQEEAMAMTAVIED